MYSMKTSDVLALIGTNQITKRLDVEKLNALEIKAGSVDAENITGESIIGKNFRGKTTDGSAGEGSIYDVLFDKSYESAQFLYNAGAFNITYTTPTFKSVVDTGSIHANLGYDPYHISTYKPKFELTFLVVALGNIDSANMMITLESTYTGATPNNPIILDGDSISTVGTVNPITYVGKSIDPGGVNGTLFKSTIVSLTSNLIEYNFKFNINGNVSASDPSGNTKVLSYINIRTFNDVNSNQLDLVIS